MISAYESECAMCGRFFFVSDGYDKENEKDEQLENNSVLPTVVIEQINGSEYTFDNASCALMFKKFNAVLTQIKTNTGLNWIERGWVF
jgi:hypothetical protein